MNVIIFSKDRALQLDLLLSSMAENAQLLFEARPKILYAFSAEEFRQGYQILREEWSGAVDWICERSFCEDTIQAVNPREKLTTFLVDDCVFYRSLPMLPEIGSGTAYAPRLGKNCTWCYNRQCSQQEGELDFACNVSLDGHIYHTGEILSLLQEAREFNGPNNLEERAYPLREFKLLYDEQSCLVNIPNNRVQELYTNQHAGGDPAALNQRFLHGERLDQDSMDFSHVIGVHQEIEFQWKKAFSLA